MPAGAAAHAAALVALVLIPGMGAARTLRVPATPGAAAAALAQAGPGDTLRLAAGLHRGPLAIGRPVVVRGEPGAIVDGGGTGTVIRISAAGAAVEDLEVRASGRRVITEDSGVQVLSAGGVRLARLVLRDVLYGVYAERAPGLAVEDCRLSGRVHPLDESGEGNGVHLWYCEAPRVAGCDLSSFTDAIYLSFTTGARIVRCRLHDNGRYGLHTMYCPSGELTGNLLTRNQAGCAIMFSNHLLVERNDILHNRGPRTYGLLLRDCSDGEFRENRLVDNTIAVFMDGSNRNRIAGNLIQDNGWGLFMFSSCAGNVTAGNSFINDDYPVALDMKYTRNQFDDGHAGNYWSENAPYDLNADGVSDQPYSPVGAFAFLSKQYPDLAVLSKSPAVAALAVAERVIPALRPSEAVDRFPLVAPPRGAGRPRGPGLASGGIAWPALAGFGALAALSLFGLSAARGRA